MSGVESTDDDLMSSNSNEDISVYLPTPERRTNAWLSKVRDDTDCTLANKIVFMDLSQLDKFVKSINKTRGCKTPNCRGNLVPVRVKSTGLGGAVSISYMCSGCVTQNVMLDTKFTSNICSEISVSIQVAFIVAGCTHATYTRALKHALGIDTVNMDTFLKTIQRMYPVVKGFLDEMCDAAKDEMKQMVQSELGSWSRAVTCADGCWQTRGWHSKNATFSIRNYQTGALLYFMHVSQKGRDRIIEEELYKGTSKAAEGFAARATLKKAKEEGMQIAIHWQDADSSSSNAVTEMFPTAEIMVCGGHAGRAHKKLLEERAKQKAFTDTLRKKFEETYPQVNYVKCHCPDKHAPGCGCLSKKFIGKAHTNFTSILMECKSQEEFVNRITGLPKHARDQHEWDGGRCNFHSLRVCTCNRCEDKKNIKCEGKPYHTRMKLSCPFHSLAYEIECNERAKQVKKLVHPILKRGHSNFLEASHNVLIRFRSKNSSLERLHYQLSTNLGLLQANLTYMHNKHGTDYHWIPMLYQRMNLPVFDGIQEALERHNKLRKKALDRLKIDEVKKRRIKLKVERTKDSLRRKLWSKKHGQDTYGHSDDDFNTGIEGASGSRKGRSLGKGKCKDCGSETHKSRRHKDCPCNRAVTVEDSSSSDVPTQSADSDQDTETGSDSGSGVLSDQLCFLDDDIISGNLCICGAYSRAHKTDCPMNSRNRYRGRTLFSHNMQSSPLPADGLKPGAKSSPRESLKPPPTKKSKPEMKVGDYVCIHSTLLGKRHLPCRIVRDFGGQYQLYCLAGILSTTFPSKEVIPWTNSLSIPLNNWRQASRVKLRSIADNAAFTEDCDCNLFQPSECITISSASEDEDSGCVKWVSNELYSLTQQDRDVVASPAGWLTDNIITAAQLLILQHFPGMSGLQPPTLHEVCAFEVHTGEFLQIINISNNHWCVVSTIGCEDGVVNVYDSLYSSVSDSTIRLIAGMVSCSAPELVVKMMDVEKQSNGSDCGVLAIAYVFDICSRLNPCTARFDHKNIRKHLVMCLENCRFSRFPLLGTRKCSPSKSLQRVPIHCSCRMPEESGDEMAECESCLVWYHRHCMDIPSEVFGDTEVSWKCNACCSRNC